MTALARNQQTGAAALRVEQPGSRLRSGLRAESSSGNAGNKLCPVMVDVRSLLTYVETSGDGPALLYLHGALEWAGYSEHFVSNLSRRHRVIQPERQGHGRTAAARAT